MTDDEVRIRCAVPHCANGLDVLAEHALNVLASGWRCPEPHTTERTCSEPA